MRSRIAGKVAIVTGSSSGIGAAIAERFVAEGGRVIINSARSVEEGQQLADRLDGSRYVQGDVSQEEDAARLVEAALDSWGRLDILVNNAGRTKVIPHADIDAASVDVWRDIFEVNVFGTWVMCQKALPSLKADGGGCIVNMSSSASLRCSGSSIPYATSKAAINHQTRLLANVVGPEVRVNAIAPGLIETPWTAGWDKLRDAVQTGSPLRRAGRPEDIAEVTLSLVTSEYMTGQVVAVDGGTSLGGPGR